MNKKTLKPACNLCNGICMGCSYAEVCNYYNDIAPYDVPMVQTEPEPEELPAEVFSYMALCEGRHEIPEAIDGAIFGNTINPLDVSGLEEHARKVLEEVRYLHLYVTGLTVALVAVLNVCRDLGIVVTLYHYNRDTNEYYKQEVR